MCTIKGCKTKPVARGLCAKHYMRQRRTGDPATIRKSGRKLDAVADFMRRSTDWSPRTLAT
jgi:hypothetical protein